MFATVEETKADLADLLVLVRQGQEIVITSAGRPVARLAALPPTSADFPDKHRAGERVAWLALLAESRARRENLPAIGGHVSIDRLLEEDRGD